MRRYTARLRTLAPLGEAQIKAAIEGELLRAPITFKLGAVALTEGNVALVEIASGEKRADLARRLKALESKTSTQLECVGWGWVVSGAAIKSAAEAPSGEHDPYISALAQTENAREYTLDARRFVGKQFVRLVSVVGFVAALVLFVLRALDTLSFNCIMLAAWPAMFFTNALSIFWTFPWASRVRCDQESIEVKYLLGSSSKRWAWADIKELDMMTLASNRAHVIRSKKISLKFSIEDFNEQPTLIKTILDRASLHFVAGSFVGTYKCFDAE